MPFQEKLRPHYYALLKQIEHRKGEKQNLSWLFYSPSPMPFKPDYFEIVRFGRTPFERRIGPLLSLLMPQLWEKLVWRKIKKAIMSTVEKKYLKDILSQYPAPQASVKDAFIKTIHGHFGKNLAILKQATFTEIYGYINQCLKEFSTVIGAHTDTYKPHKLSHNVFCLRIYQAIKPIVLTHTHVFELACFLSIRANWIDCVEENIEPFLHAYLEEASLLLEEREPITFNQLQNPYFHLHSFKDLLSSPKVILFESDNSGEIVLDLLFIEWMLLNKHKVFIASKTSPVLNDITFQDVKTLLTHKAFSDLQPYLDAGTLQLIDTHSQVSGKHLATVSESYKQAYKKSDLLILKGQGNFQSMPMGEIKMGKFYPYPYKKPIVYMMGLKAPFISQCFESVLKKGPLPKLQFPFLYYFDAKNKNTHPR